jgi:hypothetical protein
MEFLFIKKVLNEQLFNKIPDIKFKGLFNYYENKINLIEYEEIKNLSDDDFEFIMDTDTSPLNTDEEEKRNDLLLKLTEEINRIRKVFEYLIVNVEILKLLVPHYKIYDYSNVSRNIKSKIKSANHQLDIKKFLLKNKIEKDFINDKLNELLDTNDKYNLSEFKMMSTYIIIHIINIFNYYNKCLQYSKELLTEFPYIIRNSEEYLVKIRFEIFNLTNDDININHMGLIKNSYTSTNKFGETINIHKNKDKKFEILFK